MNRILIVSLLLIHCAVTIPAARAAQNADRNKDVPAAATGQEEPQATDAKQGEAQFPLKFREVWGYLMRGEEKAFRGEEPITDICYFGCGINAGGRINVNVDRPSLPGTNRRVHIVIADLSNTRLMRYILDPAKGARELLVGDIIELSKKFDGVNIDLEAVGEKDAANFLEFLRMIKKGLGPGKVFSIALPPKIIKVNDAYDYKAIAEIVDRAYIMAYDQHWSMSKPGPVASLSWCKNIMTYAKNEIPAEKLVMGIPLYGRSWRDMKIVKRIHVKNRYVKNNKKAKKSRTILVTKHVVKSQSVKTNHISRLIEKKNVAKAYSPETGFELKYRGRSREIVYCDDINAIMEKFLFYREFVDAIGFWRLGMENPEMWKEIMIQTD